MSVVSILFARWQHYIWWKFAPSGSGKVSFNSILDPDADSDHHQNLMTSKLGQVRSSLKISAKSACNFFE